MEVAPEAPAAPQNIEIKKSKAEENAQTAVQLASNRARSPQTEAAPTALADAENQAGPPVTATAAVRPSAKVESGLQGHRLAPDEVLTPSYDEEYLAYRALTDFREPYRIPPVYLAHVKKSNVGPWRPDTPLIAFINAKSGGRVGPSLAGILYRSLGQSQVFDVTEDQPRAVLSALWSNLTTAEAQGDSEAAYIKRNLRIVVAGGDGTVTWVLGAILELGLDPAPAVAVMPLGTGNDFSFNFGWGTKFEWSWVKPGHMYRTLSRYRDAEPRSMDVWRAEIEAPDATFFHEMPHSLALNEADPSRASARFWNYFSVGLDAQAAYGFHSLRENHPKLASGRLVNQAWYGAMSCSTGWFCGAAPISNTLKLHVRSSAAAEWNEITVPRSVRAIVLLNLQSYGGGRDVWGLSRSPDHTFYSSSTSGPQKRRTAETARTFVEPVYDDGLIEVIGFRDGWHTAVVMGQISSKVHAVRLAQCAEVRMELAASGGRVKGEEGTVYMQLDGEPWPQAVPAVSSGANPLVVRVGRGGQSRVLVNGADTLGTRMSQWLTTRGLSLTRGE